MDHSRSTNWMGRDLSFHPLILCDFNGDIYDPPAKMFFCRISMIGNVISFNMFAINGRMYNYQLKTIFSWDITISQVLRSDPFEVVQ